MISATRHLHRPCTQSPNRPLPSKPLRAGAQSPSTTSNSSLCFTAQQHQSAGALDHALLLFDRCPRPTCFIRNTIIKCFVEETHPRQAITFYATTHESGIQPNHHTFPVLLKACARLLALDEGRQIKAHLFKTGLESGWLEEALELIRGMPVDASAVIWRTLLGACRVHRNVEVGEVASREVLRLEPRHHGDRVLLSNIYAAARVRREMRRSGLDKEPGCSAIEVGGRVHSFVVEDEARRRPKEVRPMDRSDGGAAGAR